MPYVVLCYSIGAVFVEPSVSTHDDEPNEVKSLSRAQKKNARKKQKKREKASELLFEVEEITSAIEQASLQNPPSSSEPPPHVTTTSSKSEVSSETTSGDSLKKIRTLRKKLKQIEDLESRIASGEILKPDKDQLNKIAKKEEFLKELEELAAD